MPFDLANPGWIPGVDIDPDHRWCCTLLPKPTPEPRRVKLRHARRGSRYQLGVAELLTAALGAAPAARPGGGNVEQTACLVRGAADIFRQFFTRNPP
jgi:hypothetical protein